MREDKGDNGMSHTGEKSPSKRRIKRHLLIVLLLLITIGAVTTTVWMAVHHSKPAPPPVNATLTPEYAPQTVDPNADLIKDGDDTKMSAAEGGGAVSLEYTKEVSIRLADKSVSLLYRNPSKSTKDAVLQLILISEETETVVAQSELLPAGYQSSKMDLMDTATLSAGRYEGKFNLLYYDPVTGERAIVNTNIPVTVDVE